MVVGAFPAVKLGVLAFKQLSKPIANVMKERAKHNPFFRKYVCMPPAQFYNWVEVKTKMWALNLGKPINVPQLNEAMAIDLGANLLGETIIFLIGAGLLIMEYVRQSNKEAAKEEVMLAEKRELHLTLQELALQIERQDAKIRHLSRAVAEIDSRKWIPRLKIMSKKDDGDDDGGKGFKASQLNIDINNNGSESNASDSSNLVSSALTSNMVVNQAAMDGVSSKTL